MLYEICIYENKDDKAEMQKTEQMTYYIIRSSRIVT